MDMCKGGLCLVLLLFWGRGNSEPQPLGQLVARALRLTSLLREKSTELLKTYVHQMGLRFSDGDFSVPELSVDGVPAASIPYGAWRSLGHQARIQADLRAYSGLGEWLGLLAADQWALGLESGPKPLAQELRANRALVQGLVANLAAILSSQGLRPSPLPTPLPHAPSPASAFQGKLLGYRICQEYRDWTERTHRDLLWMSYDFPT